MVGVVVLVLSEEEYKLLKLCLLVLLKLIHRCSDTLEFEGSFKICLHKLNERTVEVTIANDGTYVKKAVNVEDLILSYFI